MAQTTLAGVTNIDTSGEDACHSTSAAEQQPVAPIQVPDLLLQDCSRLPECSVANTVATQVRYI